MAEDAEAAESALRENITRKGSNSYYYAHGATPTGPAWDGREQPRLLATTTPTTSSVRKVLFDSYYWLDEEKSVKVYIEFDNANDIADEAISLVSMLYALYSVIEYLYTTYTLFPDCSND
jgi:hypothetical protein